MAIRVIIMAIRSSRDVTYENRFSPDIVFVINRKLNSDAKIY